MVCEPSLFSTIMEVDRGGVHKRKVVIENPPVSFHGWRVIKGHAVSQTLPMLALTHLCLAGMGRPRAPFKP